MHGNGTDTVGGVGTFLSSRLIQTENLVTPEARQALTNAIVASGGGSFAHRGGKGV